jgi:hypothetical protein
VIKKRGYLATVLLVLAVVGGYVGLLPLLSSLSADPALPAAPTPVANATSSVTVNSDAIARNLQQGTRTTTTGKKKKHKVVIKAGTPTTPRVTVHGVNDGGSSGSSTGSGGTRRTEPTAPDTGAVTGGLLGDGQSGVPGGQVCSGSTCP